MHDDIVAGKRKTPHDCDVFLCIKFLFQLERSKTIFEKGLRSGVAFQKLVLWSIYLRKYRGRIEDFKWFESIPCFLTPTSLKENCNVLKTLSWRRPTLPSKKVPSARGGLTSVFGMGTGGPLLLNHQLKTFNST
jgi:hypothetical protein